MPSNLLNLLFEHRWLLSTVSLVSLLALLGSLLATPWVIARLPTGYFRDAPARLREQHGLHLAKALLGNILGGVLMLTGLIMLVTPGPGLVALLLGLSLCQFPGKHRLLQRLAAHPRVFNTLNWMRRRHRRPPFEHPFSA